MKKLFIIAATSLCASYTYAQADSSDSNTSGLYLGANYGYLKVDSDDDFDDDNDAIQGLLGYRFNPYFSIEGSVIDFGDYGGDLGDVSTDGYTFAIKGTLPLTESFALYAKLGQLWWETEYDVLGINSDEEDESLFYGAGISFDITDNLIANAQYVWYDVDLSADDVADSDDIDDVDFDTDLEHFSLGVEYRF